MQATGYSKPQLNRKPPDSHRPVDTTNPSKDSLENYFSSSRDGMDIMNIKHDIGSGFASIISANGEGRKTRLSLV